MGTVLAVIDPDQIQPGLFGGLLGLILLFLPIAAVIVAVVFIVRAVRNSRPRGGWYPDPAGSGRYRWHNGQKWTENYADDSLEPPSY